MSGLDNGWDAAATRVARDVARIAAIAEGEDSVAASMAGLVIALADEVDRYRNLTERAAKMARAASNAGGSA